MFLVVALIPMLIVGILTFGNYKRSLETHRMSMLEELVIYKSDRIEAYFLGLKSNMKMAQNFYNLKNNLPILNQFANNPTAQEFIDARKTLDRQLQKMQTALKLSDIMLVDSKGKVVYVSNPKHSPKDFLSNLPDTQQTAFKEGRNKIYFSDVFFNKVNNDKLGMLITAPLNDSNNIFIGVIVFEIDMEPVYDIINYAYGLGETGETLIGKRIKNRIVYPALGVFYSYDRKLNDRYYNFFREKARGGAGIVTVGPVGVDFIGSGIVVLSLAEDEALPSFQKLTGIIYKITLQ